jgi:hypothetical protein
MNFIPSLMREVDAEAAVTSVARLRHWPIPASLSSKTDVVDATGIDLLKPDIMPDNHIHSTWVDKPYAANTFSECTKFHHLITGEHRRYRGEKPGAEKTPKQISRIVRLS